MLAFFVSASENDAKSRNPNSFITPMTKDMDQGFWEVPGRYDYAFQDLDCHHVNFYRKLGCTRIYVFSYFFSKTQIVGSR